MTHESVQARPAFRMLVVCTGNVCRSPVMAQLLDTELGQEGWVVDSAGTMPHPGQRMTDEAIALSRQYGGQPRGHRAKVLSEHLIAQSDLVLTATREHRAAVVSLWPRAAAYTFTAKQFARILEAEDAADEVARGDERSDRDPFALVASVARLRGFAPPPSDPADDDIEDPYRRPQEVYDRVGLEIHRAVSVISSALAPAGGVRHAG